MGRIEGKRRRKEESLKIRSERRKSRSNAFALSYLFDGKVVDIVEEEGRSHQESVNAPVIAEVGKAAGEESLRVDQIGDGRKLWGIYTLS